MAAHVGLAWLDGLMDQLHRAHDNGRAANTPAQTRNLTEHRAAQIDYVQNRTDAAGEQGAGEHRDRCYSRKFSAVRATGTERAAAAEGGKETGKETRKETV